MRNGRCRDSRLQRNRPKVPSLVPRWVRRKRRGRCTPSLQLQCSPKAPTTTANKLQPRNCFFRVSESPPLSDRSSRRNKAALVDRSREPVKGEICGEGHQGDGEDQRRQPKHEITLYKIEHESSPPADQAA